MKNTFGNSISLTLFGESHGPEIGAVLDGLAPGILVDPAHIAAQMDKRRAKDRLSTARTEEDAVVITSGVFEGKTTGTPICFTIKNNHTQSRDYSRTKDLPRPGHADYTAHCKYHGYEDYRGGGHFSGRITAALVTAGGIIIPALKKKGIQIGTHIKSCGGINDREFENLNEDIERLSDLSFAVLDDYASEIMQEKIIEVKNCGDSLGGILETAVIGIDAGVGEPWFDSVESMLSHALFSIPAVKAVEFGAGFSFAEMYGSQANDPFYIDNNNVYTKTNNSGGINGGITNGMPLVFRCAIRPTPTISKEQQTIDYVNRANGTLSASGRHDPCIVHRARIVVDCVTALALADLLATKYGTDWLAL